MTKLRSALGAADRDLAALLKWVTIGLFAALTLILTANIVVRFVPILSLHWLDEIVELCFSALVFYGAAAVWMEKGHFSAGDWVERRITGPRAKRAYRLALELASLAFVLVLLKFSVQLTARSREATAVFQIPKAALYACMPISAAIMAAYSIARAIGEIIGLCKGE